MSIALFINRKDPKPWLNQLREELPGVAIDLYKEVANPDAVEMAVCWKPDANSLSAFPNIRFIQSIGAGIEHVTKTQDIQAGVRLSRFIDDKLSQDIYEYVLAGIMSHLRHLGSAVNMRTWIPQPYRTLAETTVTVLGLGEIGGHVATSLAQLNTTVKGWSRTPKSLKSVHCYAGPEQLGQALSGTDILVNVLPLTDETQGILNADKLDLLNSNGYLINVGRGHHLVEMDLLKLVKNGKLSGALLDVFQTEPLPEEHPFWQQPEITVTPHVAAISDRTRAVAQTVANWNRLQRGAPLLHEVELSRGY